METNDMVTVWAVGNNVVGYLPDSDPVVFASLADARACLVADMDRDAAERYEMGDYESGDQLAMEAAELAQTKLTYLADCGGWEGTPETGDSILRCYWLSPVDMPASAADYSVAPWGNR